MSAPANIAPPHVLAQKLAAGEPCPLYDDVSLYSDAEWREAAEYALASDDMDELAFMVREQHDADRHRAWQASAPNEREAERREFVTLEEFQTTGGERVFRPSFVHPDDGEQAKGWWQ